MEHDVFFRSALDPVPDPNNKREKKNMKKTKTKNMLSEDFSYYLKPSIVFYIYSFRISMARFIINTGKYRLNTIHNIPPRSTTLQE